MKYTPKYILSFRLRIHWLCCPICRGGVMCDLGHALSRGYMIAGLREFKEADR